MPGCTLLQSCDLLLLPCQQLSPTTAQCSLAIPNQAVLTGLSLFVQPWSPAPGLNPAGLAVGDAVELSMGSF